MTNIVSSNPLKDHTHRGGLAARVQTIWPSPGLFDRVGGRAGVVAIIEALYARIERDPELYPIFRLRVGESRDRQKMFFEEWMGGEPLYSRQVSTQGTRLFHYIFPITPRAAGRWLRHFADAMALQGLPGGVVRETLRVLGPMARALVRSTQRGLPHRLRSAGSHLVEALEECLAEDPELLQRHPAELERLLFLQAKRGNLDTVQHLVGMGVDCNIPTWQEGVFLTPWCAATAGGHREVADYLLQCGAKVDIYSAAFLGDEALVEQLLTAHPEWLNGPDPASDHQGIPPIAYAIRGGHYDLARRLLKQGAQLGPRAVHWIRHLVEAEQIDLALEIAERCDDLSALGPGRWALYPSLAHQLMRRGADVNLPPGAWLRYCTHRVGQREDAKLVAALIDRGADLEAHLDGCSALHLAVRAGYGATVDVLLSRGCDVECEDAAGGTPLGYVIFAHRRADRPALARQLLAAGADPRHPDAQGMTPLARARQGQSANVRQLVDIMQAARVVARREG